MTEFEAVVGTCRDDADLVDQGREPARELQLDALLVTRSEHGMTLIQPGQPPLHLPTEAREVFDVTGAGDTVIATLGAALAAGQDLAARRRAWPTSPPASSSASSARRRRRVAELQRAVRRDHEDDAAVLARRRSCWSASPRRARTARSWS